MCNVRERLSSMVEIDWWTVFSLFPYGAALGLLMVSRVMVSDNKAEGGSAHAGILPYCYHINSRNKKRCCHGDRLGEDGGSQVGCGRESKMKINCNVSHMTQRKGKM